MQATAKDLRFHTKELLETVTRGEEVVITYRGKDCAKLVPISQDQVEEDDLFGIWENDKESEDVEQYIRNIRKNRFHAD
ncbi:MAG: type II toxin-antitoxin system Phd/YefM family antitoxin [Xenococcus sp. (in: cyanobacteria)]